MRLIRAVVDTRALRANLATLRQRAPGSRVMAVVKANAYGHGLVPTALALSDADSFAVARLEEGIALRAAGIRQPIVLLEGVFGYDQLREAAHHGFELVVHESSQLAQLEQFAGPHRFVLWVKIDTGMNRLGFRVEEFPAAYSRLLHLRAKPLEIRALTHLARADERDCSMTAEQIERFQKATARFGLSTSIANSAGTLGWPGAMSDWIRPGLALYGVSPFDGETGATHGLQPVMSLETRVIAVRRVPRGESVGYGSRWRAERESRVAILAAGYADGLPRSLEGGTPVRVGKRVAPLAGRVSMDMIAVDVTDVPAAVGDACTLWGPDLPVEHVAARAGTIPYELLCAVSQRVLLETR
jgi:alanine racemase